MQRRESAYTELAQTCHRSFSSSRMSWFSWIFRRQAGAAKPAQPSARLKDRRSRSKASPGAKGGPSKPQHLRRKEDRSAHRDLLHAVVREAMMGAGVLSAHYKFKILSVDQEGLQFLVMVDLASGFGADMGRLGAMEAAIIQRACHGQARRRASCASTLRAVRSSRMRRIAKASSSRMVGSSVWMQILIRLIPTPILQPNGGATGGCSLLTTMTVATDA
jgi:hypothetical protein